MTTPHQFVMALCLRLRVLPAQLRVLPVTCECGTLLCTDGAAIEHFVRCNVASDVTKTHRHSDVALVPVNWRRNERICVCLCCVRSEREKMCETKEKEKESDGAQQTKSPSPNPQPTMWGAEAR